MASCLKLHGALYIFSAIFAGSSLGAIKAKDVALFVLVGSLAVLLLFLPPQISPWGFLEYLRLASKHGISFNLFLDNLSYLFIIDAPIIYIVWKLRSQSHVIPTTMYYLAAIQLCVSIIGAKPGAGFHHLLPFIPVNAYLLQRAVNWEGMREFNLLPVKSGLFALAFPGILVMMGLLKSMYADYSELTQARTEISSLNARYPLATLGITDSDNYLYT